MKKLTKVVLAASMLAALFAGCSNGSLIANDRIDAVDADGYATENGVIILEWEPVLDAGGYTVYVKVPGAEKYANANGALAATTGLVRYVYPEASEKDSDYEFKIVTNASNKENLLDAETTITVTTPEEFVDTAVFDGSKIAFTKVPNTFNRFDISFPVNAGFSYQYAITTDLISNSADLFILADGTNGNVYNGCDYIAVTKENADGDEYVVDAVVGTTTINPNGRDYYLVVKATPLNEEVATVKYVVSSTPVNVSYEGDVSWPWGASKVYSATTGKVTGVEFCANKLRGEWDNTLVTFVDNYGISEEDASNYRVYRKTTKNTYKLNALTGASLWTGSSESWELLDTPKKDTSVDHTYDTYEKYTVACTETADADDGTIVYSFEYHIVFTNANGESVWATQF